MENLISQRVREFLSYNSISINSLAKQINVAQATLNPQLRGDRTLAANIVVKILEAFPDISAEWLLRGEGDMYKSNNGSPQFEAAITPSQDESIWKAKYEAIKECYNILASTIGGLSKRNVNVG